jgi:hypothetical protein
MGLFLTEKILINELFKITVPDEIDSYPSLLEPDDF